MEDYRSGMEILAEFYAITEISGYVSEMVQTKEHLTGALCYPLKCEMMENFHKPSMKVFDLPNVTSAKPPKVAKLVSDFTLTGKFLFWTKLEVERRYRGNDGEISTGKHLLISD